ncbi:ABC transporter substrate-binding protein [Thalassotalea sediminis]|uniref:ABC transporter substrate-binding protein n=1 Tax=Thalassotalea sediminis TaxID=1759089 RepID=UPI00257433D8|nr:extracellular solute-binding protein [Thalassotalea sediminis]
MSLTKTILIAVTLYFASCVHAEQNIVNFAVLSQSEKQETVLRQQIRIFEQLYPTAKVRLRMLDGKNYVDLLENYKKIADSVDVVNWYAGERLQYFIEKNYVVNIDAFWHKHNLERRFSNAVVTQVKYQNKVYAIPLSLYVWDVFYKKSVFLKLGLTPPVNWPDFLELLTTLKAHDITPIGLSTNPPWHVAGWFDYLMLRLNGAEKYQKLIEGNLAFNSPEVINVFVYLKSLLSREYFNENHKYIHGGKIMPILYRELVGVSLIGSSSLGGIAQEVRDQIGSFPFPQIGDSSDNSIIAPMSILALTPKGEGKPYSEELLAFFSQQKVQKKLNLATATISPIIGSKGSQTSVEKEINSADYIFQFLDREMPYDMAEFTKNALAEFVVHRDIKKVTELLEAYRKTQP